jgi:hypothetical protein
MAMFDRIAMFDRRLHALVLKNRKKEAEEEKQREVDHQDYIVLWHITIRMQRIFRQKFYRRRLQEQAILRLQANFRGKRVRRQIQMAMVQAAAAQREEAERAGGRGAQATRTKLKLTGLTCGNSRSRLPPPLAATERGTPHSTCTLVSNVS